jgi:lipopolysaccharide biosynthesis glycosyltransferase
MEMVAQSRPGPIQVALATDARFVIPLAVTLASLSQAHEPGDLSVAVVHDGISRRDMTRIEESVAGGATIRWLPLDTTVLTGAHHPDFLTRATLFRLLLPEALPASMDRVVYLDCDVLVTQSLRDLYELELGDRMLAAVRDAGCPFPSGPLGTDWRSLGLPPGDPYFNAGLLVVPLSRWREEDVTRRAVQVLRTSKPRWGDQCALNAVLQGRWLELGRRWNLQTPDVEGKGLAWALWQDDVENAVRDPAVIHYSERDKPWEVDSGHPLAAEWFEVLDRTAWSGWRPRRKSIPGRAASKARRITRSLANPGPRAAT